MIKDPLQEEETPFELLELSSPDATDDEIAAAFKRRMRTAGRRLGQIKRARDTLLKNPGERAVVRLFFYDPRIAAQLQPDPGKDPESLEPARRAATEKAWAHLFKRHFPSVAVAHALAILCYWNGARAQRELEAAFDDGADWSELGPRAVRDWRLACAYWAMVVATPSFWKTRPFIPKESCDEVKEHLVETRLRHRIQDMVQRCRDQGDEGLAEAWQALLLDLSTELEVATQMAGTRIGIKGRPVCCGPMLLEQYGLVERFRRKVAEGLERKPDSVGLKAVQAALSPHTQLTLLLTEGRFEALLEAVAALPESERKQPEVVTLAVQAYLGLGNQQAEMDRFEPALKYWRKGVDEAREDGQEVPAELRERVLQLSERITVVLAQDPDQTIRLLEMAIELIGDDRGLGLRLAALLLQRGAATFIGGLQPWQGGDHAEEHLQAMREGLADLDRSAALGDPQGKEQASAARDAMVGAGADPNLSENARRLISEADREAKGQHWDMACACLLVALGEVKQEYRSGLEKKLAVLLINYGVEKFNEAAESLKEISDPNGLQRVYQDEYEAWLDLKHAAELDPTNADAVQAFGGVGQQLQQFVQQLGGINPQLVGLLANTPQDAERARKKRLDRWKRAARDRLAGGEGSLETGKRPSKPEEFRPGWFLSLASAVFWVWLGFHFGWFGNGTSTPSDRSAPTSLPPSSVTRSKTEHPSPPPPSAERRTASSPKVGSPKKDHRTTFTWSEWAAEQNRPRSKPQASSSRIHEESMRLVDEARGLLTMNAKTMAVERLAQARQLWPENPRIKPLLEQVIRLDVAEAQGLGAKGRVPQARATLDRARRMAQRFGLSTDPIAATAPVLAAIEARRSSIQPAAATHRQPLSRPRPAASRKKGITLADLKPYIGQQVVIERTDGRQFHGRLSALKDDQLVLRHSAVVLGDQVSMWEWIGLSEIAAIHLEQ